MKHTIRIERHLIRDILASVLGGGFVVAVTQKSWIAAIMTVGSGAALFLTERADIEEEEQ